MHSLKDVELGETLTFGPEDYPVRLYATHHNNGKLLVTATIQVCPLLGGNVLQNSPVFFARHPLCLWRPGFVGSPIGRRGLNALAPTLDAT
jgi:hypothetical protein